MVDIITQTKTRKYGLHAEVISWSRDDILERGPGGGLGGGGDGNGGRKTLFAIPDSVEPSPSSPLQEPFLTMPTNPKIWL